MIFLYLYDIILMFQVSMMFSIIFKISACKIFYLDSLEATSLCFFSDLLQVYPLLVCYPKHAIVPIYMYIFTSETLMDVGFVKIHF